MQINRVTFTGVDDNVHVKDMISLSKRYPFVEWGILLSPSRIGTPRYPSNEKIAEIVDSGLPLSAHLCGDYARQVLERADFSLVDRMKAFNRIQLNYNFSNSPDWSIKPVLMYARANPNKALIFQANKSNQTVINTLGHKDHTVPNIHFLYDSSGGRGVEMNKELGVPYPLNYTGYSGGIHDRNIEVVIGKIMSMPFGDTVWIDMESGLRTEDVFDWAKVEDIVHECYRRAKIGDQL